MNRIYIFILLLFLITGCTLVDNGQRPDTKKYVLTGFDNKTYLKDNDKKEEDKSVNDDIENLSSYIVSYPDEKNVQEITNIKSPIKRNFHFNSDLAVIKKQFDKKRVKLSIEEMPLNKFLNLVFGKVLNVDYVLDKNVQNNKQPVSINIKEDISKEKLFRIVNNILDEFNIIVDVEKNIFYIKQATHKAAESVYKVYFGNTVPKGVDDNTVIYMLRPYFYNKLLNKHTIFVKEYFLSKNGTIELDTYENIIKIKDKVKNIKKALEFYDFIDQPTMRNKSMQLVRMENLDVDKFIEQVTPILKSYGILISKDLRSSGVQFVPIKQINSFLLLSDKPSWVKTVMFWKKKLDIVKSQTAQESSFFVYKPSNRKAEELVTVISNFIKIYDKNSSKNSTSKPDNQNQELKVVLDKERNNIIIYTSKQKYQNIKKMLTKLDTLPKQVLIEVTIAEIKLRDSLQFGLEWFLEKNTNRYGYNFRALSSGSSGILGQIFSTSGDIGAAFNALAEKKYVNVLSNPKLLVLNNHSASINIGDQVPIITSQASASDIEGGGSTASIMQNIQYQSTGISLNVTPIINSKGFLTLHISQSVSNAQKNTMSDISSPLIFNRSLSTDVVLKSGESVILGGLITEDKSKDETKIPFLGDIPILGKLFSTSGDSIDKTELVILVKPTIVSSNSDAKVVTDALLNMMHFR